MSAAAAVPSAGLQHMIYPYAGQQQYVNGTLAYIEQARSEGAAVVIAATEEHRRALHPHLADDAGVAFMDTAAVGHNPGRLIPAWQEWIGARADGSAVHGINDTSPVRSAAHAEEARYAEWLLNLAFAAVSQRSLLCPVDTTAQPRPTMDALTRCHPLLWNGLRSDRVDGYSAAPFAREELPAPPAGAERTEFGLEDLSDLRAKVAAFAVRHSLPRARVGTLTLAVSEVATNSIRHGGGRGTLRFWLQDDAIVCDVRDAGVIVDPLVGRVRPSPTQLGGRGLWFVNHLCDLVQVRSAPGSGTCVRLWMHRGAVG